MNISIETVLKQAICAALAVALTLLSTQSVVRSSGLTTPAAPALFAQQAAASTAKTAAAHTALTTPGQTG